MRAGRRRIAPFQIGRTCA